MANLTKRQCLNLYSDLYGDRTNVLVVVQDTPESDGMALLEYTYHPAWWYSDEVYWPCANGTADGPDCGKPQVATPSNLEAWTKYNHLVLYCLNEKREVQHCRLNYSPAISISMNTFRRLILEANILVSAICCVSSLKCLCIMATCWYFSWHLRETTLCTLGDAVSSFLQEPDRYTAHMGLVERSSLATKQIWTAEAAEPIVWRPRRRRWYSAASTRRWVFALFM